MAALALLDEAVRLLRRASLSTFLCHWAGSIPFAFAFLVYWSSISNPRTPGATVASESLVLALLLVWMNCWRAVFAGRLQALLAGTLDPPWTLRRVTHVAALQSFLAATKLVVLPVASLVIFPLAGAVAFYRTATLLSVRDLDVREVIRQSRRIASLDVGQSWTLLPIVLLLWLIVVLNLALAILLLPQLIRMLTGFESTFSRSGLYFAFNGLFLWLAVAVSWIVFDPYLQAVYCVRCFRGESKATGDDLRAALRALGTVAVAVVLMVAALPARAAVNPADLRQSIEQTAQSHDYDWRLANAASADAKTPLIVRLADRMIQGLKAAGHFLDRALTRLFRWLFGSPDAHPGEGQFPKTGLPRSVYALIVVVVLIAAYIVWRKLQAKPAPVAVASPTLDAIHLESDDLTPDRLPEQSWLQLAERCAAEGNLRLALRALYLANLAWLGRVNLLTISQGKTNHEYELELRRRARDFPGARQRFVENVATFERAWYGLHDVAPDDFALFRRRMDEMKAEASA